MPVLAKLFARLRERPHAERRAAPRYQTHLENRLFVHVHLLDPTLERLHGAAALRLVGYTRDVSESGLGVILPGTRVAGRSIVGAERPLRVLLGLPGEPVEMSAVAVRDAELEDDETGRIVGIQIREMKPDARARYHSFLRSLAVPDF